MIIDRCEPINEGEQPVVRVVMSLSEARELVEYEGKLGESEVAALKSAIESNAERLTRQVDELLASAKAHGITVNHTLIEELRRKYDPQKSFAPWTDEEVANLNAYQRSGRGHPFTGRRRTSGSETILVATRDGWVEPEGGPVVQDWAHKLMVECSEVRP